MLLKRGEKQHLPRLASQSFFFPRNQENRENAAEEIRENAVEESGRGKKKMNLIFSYFPNFPASHFFYQKLKNKRLVNNLQSSRHKFKRAKLLFISTVFNCIFLVSLIYIFFKLY